MIRRHRGVAGLAAAAALAAAGTAYAATVAPPVVLGALGVTGAPSAATVTITGQAVEWGTLGGARSFIVVRTTTSPAVVMVNGKPHFVRRGKSLQIPVPDSQHFWLPLPAGPTMVHIHGNAIAMTVSGTAKLLFTGKGTYTPSTGVPVKWPKTAIMLQTRPTAAKNVVRPARPSP